MDPLRLNRADRAQLAMMLEVSAFPKPGNVDRCHDYPDTRIEHFLASAILVRPALEKAMQHTSGVGKIIHEAVELSSVHSGGNTHFGAFILLIPLIMGDGIEGATRIVRETTVEDAIEFYRAFGRTNVRVISGDELDVNDPGMIDELRTREMTLYDVMLHSAPNDMVAREWVNGFALTKRTTDRIMEEGCGRDSVVRSFLWLLSIEPDTFVIKKHGRDTAWEVMQKATEVREGVRDLETFDAQCIKDGINPGSIADIIIASIYSAMGEGWEWDC
ncbi:MAG TPA: triphosphoribosyl-dephospho-CoA synthase [Methanoregulaceae archaeon]|nr:triphosphoribosyl-dephospho-CoA synthase [Methanoregulaceae archaeon]